MSKEKFQIVMNINRWFIVPVVLLLPTMAYSQRFLLGVKVAGQITKSFTNPTSPDNAHDDRGLFGPTGEVFLPHRLSLEFDALYKRNLGFTEFCCFNHSDRSQVTSETIDETTHAWELPLILKWRLPRQAIPVFLGGGFAARHVAGTKHTFGTHQQLLPVMTPPTAIDQRGAADVTEPWAHGPVVSAGVAVHAGILHIQPELRYTRWNTAPFPFDMKLDNFQVLIGVAVGK